MRKWLVRAAVGLVALIVLLVGGGAGYLWYQGSDAMNRAEASGWFDRASADGPLSVFETMVAKVEFGDTWGRTGYPCRSVARMAGMVTGERSGMPVSQMLARDIETAAFGELSPGWQFRLLAFACLLETKRDDAELLRAWLRRAYFGHESRGAEAASSAAFNKPLSELDTLEAATLVALLRPGLWKQKGKWDTATRAVLLRASKYDWDGKTMKRIEAGTVQ